MGRKKLSFMMRLQHYSLLMLFCTFLGWNPNLLAAKNAVDVPASSDDKAVNEQKLAQLKQEIKKVKSLLTANKSRYDSAADALKNIELAVAESSQTLRDLKQKLEQSQNKIEDLEKQQAVLLQDKEKQQSALAQQIRSAYGNGNEEYLKLLLNQMDPAEFARMLSYFRYLNDARTAEIKQLSVTLQKLNDLREKLTQENLNLSELTLKAQKQVEHLVSQQQERQKIVTLWQAKVQSTDKQLRNLLSDEKELQSLIDVLRKAIEVFFPKETLKGLKKLKGKLMWPVAGRLLHRYGSERYRDSMNWHGVMLKAKEGAPVHSISTGRVVFSDWLRGYGLLTMIDHGEGYLSLYGHNQSLVKQVGDWVEPGEVIAYVGDTGGLSSPSLYFEIRHDKSTENPAIWCR
ncbi:MAG: peptidase M23 [Gammaproteobacteria bacterium CG22_combo_CG10-13_8_21_14_all_40_8]|nr:MAG: peptidase M23 [Gammaproteobacteria bacterium CG22_combo_CG10-13_8_21_14_all_40_8]